MTKAQQDFIARGDTHDAANDARHFLTWYHPDDIHRIAYSMYKEQPEKTTNLLHAPVMVLASASHSFEEKMTFCRHLLDSSNKQILPFVIAPEIGAAHFMAGFIRINHDKAELFLFNPTAYNKDFAAKRLSIKDMNDVGGMVMQVSSTIVQTIEKDKLDNEHGPALVSCGPISLMFIEYLLKNPNFALQLDEQFSLPEQLTQLASMEKIDYQKQVCLQRLADYERLGNMNDENLAEVDAPYYQLIDQFLEGSWTQDAAWDDDFEDEFVCTEAAIADEDSVSNQAVTVYNQANEVALAASWQDKPLCQEKTMANEQDTLAKKENLHKDALAFDFEKERLNLLLEQLKIKTAELIKKGNTHAHRYTKAQIAAEKLIITLEKNSEDFFTQNMTRESFHMICSQAILEAGQEFQNHRGWHKLHPLLKALIGIIATLTLIPALLVQNQSKHGYVATFFTTPKTDASEKLESFEQELNDYLA